jgi:predicted alpha/beta hydrolase
MSGSSGIGWSHHGRSANVVDWQSLWYTRIMESIDSTARGTPIAEAVGFRAADRVELSGRFFRRSTDGRATPVLVCPATGVPQRYYAPFAAWLAERGHDTLTLDYRGIGESLREPHVRHCRARKAQWGQLDMPAALDWLRERTHSAEVNLVGHSAGAQLVGLMPNHAAIRRVLMVAGSSGYVAGIAFPQRLAAEVFLRLYLPVVSRLLGYAPLRVIRYGEDLPAGVARDWARWCRRPGYVANGFGREIERHYYDEFRAPILALYAADDSIASDANVRDLLRLFPRATSQIRLLDPRQHQVPSIGHTEFFRRNRQALWPLVTEWLSAEIKS